MSQKYSTRFIAVSNAAVISISIVAAHHLASERSNAFASSDADYTFVIDSDWQDCQQIGKAYQTVYSFETVSFYVSICQKENSYFYSGEAKKSGHNSIFIPAYPLSNGGGFKAENGNVSYLVLLPFSTENNLDEAISPPTEAILTIKRNQRLVSVESSLDKYCHQSQTPVAFDTLEPQSQNSNQIAGVLRQQDVGLEFSVAERSDRLLPTEIFNSDSRFDFYRIGGELHRLTTCN